MSNASGHKRSPGRPAKEKSPDLKQALLEAAINLFGERGFDGASLSQIAGQTGADVGLTRYYFGSKVDLWESAVGYLGERFAEDLVPAPLADDASNTDALKSLIRAFVIASAHWPQVSRIIVFDGDKTDARGEFIAERLVKPFYQLLSELIAGAKAEGAIPNVSDRTLFFMITHGGSFPMALPALTNALPGGDIASVKGLREHADAIIAILFASEEDL